MKSRLIEEHLRHTALGTGLGGKEEKLLGCALTFCCLHLFTLHSAFCI